MADLDGWDKYYRCVIEETSRLVDEMLDRFRVSLGDFLYGMLNWPTDDWGEQLNRFVEHTRYYGLIIEPESIRTIHDLIEARVNGTGPFAVLGPYAGAGGKGSGVWTESELEQIRKSGKFPVDAQWHHDPTVANRPDLAGDPSIVRPVRGGTQGHLDAHGGDFRKPYAQEGE
ncbi:MAG: hypothetical protein WD063_02890 [Pirellulales bacterium]